MIAKFFGKLLNGMIAKKIKNTLKESNIPKVSIGKLKLTIPVKVENLPAGIGLDTAEGFVNGAIEKHIKPKIGSVFDFAVTIS
jgi:hypothetical protein